MFCHKVCTSGLRNAFLGRIWKERPIASEARYKDDSKKKGKKEGRERCKMEGGRRDGKGRERNQPGGTKVQKERLDYTCKSSPALRTGKFRVVGRVCQSGGSVTGRD